MSIIIINTTMENAQLSEQDYIDHQSGFCSSTGIFHSILRLGHRLPQNPNLDLATYILTHIQSVSDKHPSKPALIDSVTHHELTFSQLRRSALSFASALHGVLNIGKGDVVLLLSPNSVIYPAICIGVLAAGGVITTANPVSTAPEVAKQVRDSGAKLAIVEPEEAYKMVGCGVPTLFTRAVEGEVTLSAEELMAGGELLDMESVDRPQQSDVAALLYSSGTTGDSKGVALTHKNLISIIELLLWTCQVTMSEDDVYLAFIPMFHVYGLAFFALGLPTAGATSIIMPRFDLNSFLTSIVHHRVTNIPAVPPVIPLITRAAKQGNWDLSCLRRVSTGAAPLPPHTAAEFRTAFPWMELRSGYGLTESCGAATFFVSDKEAKRRPEAVGQVLPEFEAKVVCTERCMSVGIGEVGELWLKGVGVMKGYFGNDEATMAAIDGDGWLRTGDLVYFDGDGYMYVVDRMKELIKYKGFQVAPAELEGVLVGHSDIVDAAVIPVEDEEAGEIPMAYVVREAQSETTSEEVIEFVASQVAPYKKIRKVAFINSIPRSAAGKILRKQLVALSKQSMSSKL